YKEMLVMYKKISGIAKEIDSTNLSPLELIYIIYNKVRERIYTKEEENEDWKKSRNLFEVLNDKKIVCVGFANLFTALCDCFNIKSEIILWYPMENYKRGHASNIVFVNDLKYNVNGAFTVDVTWDSKKNENDSSYISNIRSLFLSYRAECNYKKGYHLESPKSNTIDTINRKYYNYTNFLKLNVPANIIENPLKSLIDKINDFYKLIGIDEISYTIDELINKPILVRNIYNEWRNYFDNTLEDDTFLNLIESVRRIEMSNEPNKANESTATAEEILNTNIEFITTKRRTEFFNELFSRTKEKPTN
ncbi:MAG: transglutaminase domain-containing protein, partial [Bacilli bacterium]